MDMLQDILMACRDLEYRKDYPDYTPVSQGQEWIQIHEYSGVNYLVCLFFQWNPSYDGYKSPQLWFRSGDVDNEKIDHLLAEFTRLLENTDRPTYEPPYEVKANILTWFGVVAKCYPK